MKKSIEDVLYSNELTVDEFNFLRKQVNWNELDKKQAESGLKNSIYLTVARLEQQAVGMARVVGDGGYIAVIVDVIVLPDYQNKGIGKQLMKNVMNYLENSIEDNQCLMVNLMAAKEREGFYKKFGFIERPNNSMGAGMVKWLYY